jgi:DNA invertase Pin-like site-specific DNA recombinase
LRDSGGDSQEQSTAQQRRVVEAYCEQHGLFLQQVFEDAARKGGSTKGRAAFLEMVGMTQEPDRPNGLLLWNYARFARDMDDSAYYRATIRKNGMFIHSLTDPIPPGEFSRVIETLIDYANEEKRRQTSRDVKRGLADRVKAGFTSGGPPPRGYRAVKTQIGTRRDGHPRMGTSLEPDPELGPLATLAFQMRAEGKSLPEIMDATHGKLYKTKNCFSTFFANKSYLGVGRCGEVEIENHHPALIDRATWEAVRDVQQRAKKNLTGNLLHPKRLNSPSLLSGMAVCVHCGTPIIREVSGYSKWQAYLCGKKRNRSNWHACEGRQINAAKADKAVLDTVLEKILTPDFVTELLDEVRAQVSNTAEIDIQEDRARQALTVCERAIDRLVDTIEETDSQAAKARLKERENERARLQFEITAILARKEAARLVVTPEALQVVLAYWSGEFETARQQEDIRSLQSLLRRFVTKIELGYNIAKIWYTYPVDAFEDKTVSKEKWSGPHLPYRVITKALSISWS